MVVRSQFTFVAMIVLGITLGGITSVYSACNKGCNKLVCIRMKTGNGENDFKCRWFNGMICAQNTWYDIPAEADKVCKVSIVSGYYEGWDCMSCTPVCPQLAHSRAVNCTDCDEFVGTFPWKSCVDANTP
jgi:hypothetical protein